MSRLALVGALWLVACGTEGSSVIDAGADHDAVPTDGHAADGHAADAIADAAVDAFVMPDAPAVDETPPALVSIVPANGAQIWLAERIRFAFDEPITGTQTVTATLGGTPVGATVTREDGDRTLAIAIDPAVRGIGTLTVSIGGTIRDAAGNAATLPIAAEFAVPAWQRPAIDRGVASGTPAIAVSDTGAVAAAWIVGASGARTIAVSLRDRGTWTALGNALGNGDAASPAIAFDDSGAVLVGYVEGGVAQVARWSGSAWTPLASPGDGSKLALARAASGGAPMALVAGSAITVFELDANDAWHSLGAAQPITGSLVGDPVIAIPTAGQAAIAWVDSSSNVARLRAARYTGSWASYAPIVLGSPPLPDSVSIAARGNTIAIAWDQFGGSFGIYAAKATLAQTSWTRLGRVMDIDAAGNAVAPAIALDAAGAPLVAWTELVETKQRGVVARWDGAKWAIVGGQTFLASDAAKPARPTLALHAGQAPAIAYVAGGALHLAELNGPKVAGVGMTRPALTGCSFDGTNPPARLLQTGCFTIPTAFKPVPHAGLVPYDVVAELWSDGARKRRWIGLPGTSSMTATATGAWGLPVGGFVVKEFAIETTPGDPATRKAVETRFLTRTPSGIVGYTYQWRDNGTDADLLNDGEYRKDWATSSGTYTHVYPSQSQCLSCHEGSWGPLLGVRPQQLARWYDYNGKIADQLATLVSMNIGPSSSAQPWISPHDASQSFELRTRGYMAANCAHCHNPNHIAIKDLRPTTPLAQTRLCEVIVPGSPQNSVVYSKVTSRPGMPPLGTLIADPLAEHLLGSWISGMTSCP